VKRTWLIAVLTLAAAVLAISGLTLSGSAQAATARPAAAPAAQRSTALTVVFDCPGQYAMVRPKSFVLACADGNSAFEKLAWSTWAPGLASAKGTLVQNDCTPYCAAGHFHRYPALVVLWGSKAVGSGEHAYTKLTLILTGARPGYYDSVHHKWVYAPVTQTFPLVTSSSPGA
jgi:hypothetical protein